MSPVLLFLVALYQLQTLINSELLDTPRLNLNSYTSNKNDFNSFKSIEHEDESSENEFNDDEIPFIKTGQDQAEVKFRQPIDSVNIDYSRNAIVLKFRKQHLQRDPDEENRRRITATDFIRFGKRAYEETPEENSLRHNDESTKGTGERFERSSENDNKNGNMGLRDSRGDNFMRFGRNPADFMRLGRRPDDFVRFGRSPADFMRLGRTPGDFMRFRRDPADFIRFGRGPGEDFMRFGRSPAEDFMRFGRSPGQDFMRFGRSPGQDFMRFGRVPADFMRFGRSPGHDFMRFGRNPEDFIRFGRSNQKMTRANTDKNFMRFGRPDNFMRFGRSQAEPPTDRSSNFMRFGRSYKDKSEIDDKEANHTTTLAKKQKNELKAVAKIIHESKSNNDDSNPMDKAIQVLFNKQNSENNELTKAEEDVDLSTEQYYQR